MNKRVTPKERGLIKGSLRRVFSRSELRKAAIDATRIVWKDPSRPRVTKWSKCPKCIEPIPTYLMEVDHISPVVPINSTLADMDANQLVDNIWCDPTNLLALCINCHKIKSRQEASQRRELKKRNKK